MSWPCRKAVGEQQGGEEILEGDGAEWGLRREPGCRVREEVRMICMFRILREGMELTLHPVCGPSGGLRIRTGAISVHGNQKRTK